LQAAIGQGGAGGQDLLDRRVFDHIAPHHPGRFRLPMQAQQAAPLGAIAGIEHGRRERRAASGLQSRQQGRLAHQRRNGEVAGDGEFADRGFIADIDFATRSAQARTGARREFLQVVGVIKIHARLWHRMAAAIVPAMSELQDLTALIRANTPLIVIETQDEARVVDLFRQALMQVWRALYRWSITEGLRRHRHGPRGRGRRPARRQRRPAGDEAGQQRGIYLLLDFHPYLGYASTSASCATSSSAALPAARAGAGRGQGRAAGRTGAHGRALQPAPARRQCAAEDGARGSAAYARENGGRRVEADGEAVQQIVRNLQGLSLTDARRIARQLIHADGALSAADLPQLAKLKFELLNRSGHLHYEYDTARFNEVAGARG
jgi:hypothetical protein